MHGHASPRSRFPPPRHGAEHAALRAIARHWLRHPAAADSAEGIGRFWLGDPALGPVRAERALAVLALAGLVRAQPAADGRVRWRRRPGPTDAHWRRWLRRQR